MNLDIIGPLQARVMDFIWSVDRPVGVGEVTGAINQKAKSPLAYTTFLTVMRNLAKRGMLLQEKEDTGHRHRWTATITRAEYESWLAKHIVSTYFQDCLDRFVVAYDEDCEGSDMVAEAKR